MKDELEDERTNIMSDKEQKSMMKLETTRMEVHETFNKLCKAQQEWDKIKNLKTHDHQLEDKLFKLKLKCESTEKKIKHT